MYPPHHDPHPVGKCTHGLIIIESDSVCTHAIQICLRQEGDQEADERMRLTDSSNASFSRTSPPRTGTPVTDHRSGKSPWDNTSETSVP